MITDNFLLFCDSLSCTDTTDAVPGGSVIDLGVKGDAITASTSIRNLSAGQPLYLYVKLEPVTYTAGDNQDCTVTLTADAAATTTAGSQVLQTLTFNSDSADFLQGAVFYTEVTAAPAASKRYIGVQVVNKNLTAQYTCGLSIGKPSKGVASIASPAAHIYHA